jgi:ketose-bisphosphate aldolase
MKEKRPRKNLFTLKQVLEVAERHQFAVGSFSPRYVPMISPVLKAAEKTESPVIVQISQKEFDRYGITASQFGKEFFKMMDDGGITVPVVLHLDHAKDFHLIMEAIEAGFTSVMIDASEKELEENIAITKEVVRYAHGKGISVEAELGKIGTTDFVETDKDEELYTDPEEAKRFVEETGCDALAVSVGTAHGVYLVRKPKVDIERIKAIRTLTSVHLVLHGGSGVPADVIHQAIRLPGGGISKVNIATDLELAMLGALGREDRMTNAECEALPSKSLEKAQRAVEEKVVEKIRYFVQSEKMARVFQ